LISARAGESASGLSSALGNTRHRLLPQEKVTIRLLFVVESMRGGPDPNTGNRAETASEIMIAAVVW
jgi:hypothetical protein